MLTGNTFARLIKDILDSFNNKKIPEIKCSIERVIENEKKEMIKNIKKRTD